jgi:hypothetical protein
MQNDVQHIRPTQPSSRQAEDGCSKHMISPVKLPSPETTQPVRHCVLEGRHWVLCAGRCISPGQPVVCLVDGGWPLLVILVRAQVTIIPAPHLEVAVGYTIIWKGGGSTCRSVQPTSCRNMCSVGETVEHRCQIGGHSA